MPPKRKQPLPKPPRPKRSCSRRFNPNIFSSDSSPETATRSTPATRQPAPRPSTSAAVSTPEQEVMTLRDLSNQFRVVTNRIEARLSRLEPPATPLRFSALETESDIIEDVVTPLSTPTQQPNRGRRQPRPRTRPTIQQRRPTARRAQAPERVPTRETPIQNRPPTTPTHNRSPTPPVRRPELVTPPEDIVARLLQAAAPSTMNTKGKLKNFLPHKYILRGDACTKIGQGDSTMPEHLDAIFRMRTDDECPDEWKDPLITHIAELSEMAILWDWPTCRRWSEKVFRMIAEGKLPGAWTNIAKITDMQRNITSLCAKASAMEAQRAQARKFVQTSTQSVPPSAQTSSYQSQNKDYQRDRDGKPCHNWNWGKDCGNSASHGVAPDASPHICAWCAYRYHRSNMHPEKDCINKRKFLEKKNNEAGQDFH